MKYTANIDTYEIKDDAGNAVFSCFLYPGEFEGMAQIHLETLTDVYDGPVNWLLNSDVVEKRK
jgi:hypothetical protein